MRIGPDLHLTYCPAADAAGNWAALFADMRHCALRLKERLAPHEPFGLGLRLSPRAASELLAGKTLATFAAFLRDHHLYVFTISRMRDDTQQKPIGADANIADWHDEGCVQHTLRLITVLKALLPRGVEGGISTLALVRSGNQREGARAYTRMSENLARVAMALSEVYRREDKLIHLDLESGPDSLMENTPATIAFYDRLLLPVATGYLTKTTGWTRATTERVLRTHIRVCVDSARSSANFEIPTQCIRRLTQAGISIGRLHVGAALKARFGNSPMLAADHREWRIDARVPLFVDRVGEFSSTRDETRSVLQALTLAHFTHHIEIETDNRDILPTALKQEARSSIEREYRWVMESLHQRTGETIHA